MLWGRPGQLWPFVGPLPLTHSPMKTSPSWKLLPWLILLSETSYTVSAPPSLLVWITVLAS